MAHISFSLWTVATLRPSHLLTRKNAMPLLQAVKSVTQRNVASSFKMAYLREATHEKAENSFRACATSPSNSYVLSSEDFGPEQVSLLKKQMRESKRRN
jgi:hypothetical protein